MHDHLNQIAIHAYYAGEHDAGRRACERLLSASISADLEHQTRANRTWYTQTLSEIGLEAQFRPFALQSAHDGWSLFNPTIALDGDELLAIVRSSNYRIIEGRYVIPPEDGDRIRTENLLCRVSADLERISEPRVISGPDYPANDYPVEGLEDCRLRRTARGWGVSATARNVHGWDGRCRQVIADLDVEAAAFSGLKVLESGELQLHEKNWMPVESRPEWVYAPWHAGHTVTVDEDELLPGAYQIIQRHPAPLIAKEFRGGSQLVRFRDGWIAAVHEVAEVNGRRIYEHRFAWWDASLRLSRISRPFAFRESRSIEFAAGAAVTRDRLVVSFGVRDAEAWLVSLREDEVWDLLTPVS